MSSLEVCIAALEEQVHKKDHWDAREADTTAMGMEALAERLLKLSASVKQEAAQVAGPISAEETAARELIDAETAEGECTFWFAAVAVILCNTEAKTLPSFTELSQREGALVKQKISRGEAFRGVHRDELCAISHRWEAPETPDGLGVQMNALREHLRAKPQIKYVWYDYWVRAPPADLSPPAVVHSSLRQPLSRARHTAVHAAGRPERRREEGQLAARYAQPGGEGPLLTHAQECEPALPRLLGALPHRHLVFEPLLDAI